MRVDSLLSFFQASVYLILQMLGLAPVLIIGRRVNFLALAGCTLIEVTDKDCLLNPDRFDWTLQAVFPLW